MRLRASSSPIGPGRGLASSRPGGATAWLPSSDPDSLLWLPSHTGVVASAGRITSHVDQSGAGNTVTSIGGVSTRPLLTTWPAGLNAMATYYDGGDQLATAAGVLPAANGSPFTIFLVCAFDDLTFRTAMVTSVSGGVAFSQSGGGSSKQVWKRGVAFDDDGPSVTTPISIAIVGEIGTTPGSELYVNGTLVATTSPNAPISTPSGALYLGSANGGQYFKGFLPDIWIIKRKADLATRNNWSGYTMPLYGV